VRVSSVVGVLRRQPAQSGVLRSSCFVFTIHMQYCNTPTLKTNLIKAFSTCDEAERVDVTIHWALFAVNAIGNLWIFGDPVMHRITDIRKLAAAKARYKGGAAKRLTNEQRMRRKYMRKTGERFTADIETETEDESQAEVTAGTSDDEETEKLSSRDRKARVKAAKQNIRTAQQMEKMLDFIIGQKTLPPANLSILCC
jgi:hypothetical protein